MIFLLFKGEDSKWQKKGICCKAGVGRKVRGWTCLCYIANYRKELVSKFREKMFA